MLDNIVAVIFNPGGRSRGIWVKGEVIFPMQLVAWAAAIGTILAPLIVS